MTGSGEIGDDRAVDLEQLGRRADEPFHSAASRERATHLATGQPCAASTAGERFATEACTRPPA